MGFCNWKHCGNSLCRRFVSEPEMTCSGKKDEENLLPSRIFACSFLICYICSYSFCQSRSCMILRRARWHPQCGLEGEWLYCELREARDALDPKARQPWITWISTLSFSWPLQSLMKALCLWGSGVWLSSWCRWPQRSKKDDFELSAIGYRLVSTFWTHFDGFNKCMRRRQDFCQHNKDHHQE